MGALSCHQVDPESILLGSHISSIVAMEDPGSEMLQSRRVLDGLTSFSESKG